MKLIKELIEEENLQFITEEKDGEKRYYIEGVFMQADVKNKNGRVYGSNMLAEKVEEYSKNFIEKNRAYGELGHPSNPSINLERVSHRIISLRRDGSNFVGKAQVSSTPYGNIVKGLLEDGGKLGVSSRGLGSLMKEDGILKVQSDFLIVTPADIVADPSAPDAFVEGIMEGREWVWDNGIIREKTVEDYKQVVEKTSSKDLKMVKLKLFEDFLSKL
ncbi:MAG: primosomal protein [Rickettsiales bacterium]|nr:primosomal protein [Rickettsiales bacterium]|tara:strand:- start:27284 stop:27934 length:651 start_codon:yes stop_codon:yes gene_type:complete